MSRATASRARSTSAVLLIDVLSDFAFPDGPALVRRFRRCVSPVARLVSRARASGVPVIYVNDNFRRWRASAEDLVACGQREGAAGADVVRALAPERRDYFVLKPRHSGFYLTPLELLLAKLRVRDLVLVGMATDSCILLTACDAHMRGFTLRVPADGVAATTAARDRGALALIRNTLDATTPKASSIRFQRQS